MTLEILSRQIADHLVEDKNSSVLELVSYGISSIISFMLNFTIMFVISYLFNTTSELLWLLIFYLPNRAFHKGYHCKKFLECIFFTNLIFLSFAVLSKLIKNLCVPVFFMVLLFSLELVFSKEKNIKLYIIELSIFLFNKKFKIISEVYQLLSVFLNILLILGRKNG